MKTPKSHEADVTPTKKKLKQARLPFMLLSDVSPATETTQTRKRKLSAPESEPVTKLGKVTKENDKIDDLVVISDEDCKDETKILTEDKTLNPYVKLVDSARKKKQMSKTLKKKKNGKDSKNGTNPVETKTSEDLEQLNGSACMEIDNSDNNIEIPSDGESTDVSSKNNDINVVNEKCNIENNEVKDIVDCHKTDKDEKIEDGDCNESKNIDEESNIVTPKRSTRNRSRIESKLDTSQTSVCDVSAQSNATPQTPRQTRNSISSSTERTPNNSAILTPKQQVQKKLDSAKKKEKEKQDREMKRQQEKEERAKQKQEKEEQKRKEREEKEEMKRKEKEEKEEQKRKEKEEKEELRRKEKEEKERQKDLEKQEREKLKKKEREEKEEMRRREKEAREEEKKKKQEALEIERQEQEQKKKKAAEAFANFFVQKQKTEKDQHTIGPVSINSVLSSFTIKADMRLAPTTRNYISDEQKENLDKFLEGQNVPSNKLYVKSLKEGLNKPMSSGKTWPLSDKENDDDVMIVEDDLPPIDDANEILSCETSARERLRPKLLSFHENRRPPYWGTWRKRSTFVTPRRPFQQDQKHVDYEVDSDEEWEEEQEGESIDGSAAGSDDEPDADEYEVDNEVFVPHGYLSDEEATVDEDDVLSLSPETQKARLKHLEDEFESELKKPTEKLKPRMYGLLWETVEGEKPEKCVDALWSYFKKLSMIMNDPTTLLRPSHEPEENDKKKIKKKKSTSDVEQTQPNAEKKKKPKQENKNVKRVKPEAKKPVQELKQTQPGINTFLTKLKSP
ncbi:PREDICTED: chromatin assembly factor 1 subunit A-B-like [Papilio xuthus]|uniref:Chromatin assembly factor 1 subunit A-B-like n=1 Tax=Papilio xuthus TaxID=66420 RepID=A0AAJ6ZCX2_PAPXU|nr:PREDICTED: chromatin assembly factor 1 subunit A-B-like [Papilio xuthus]